MTESVLNHVSRNINMRELAEARSKFLFDQFHREMNARDEGREEGIKEGRKEERIKMARSLLQNGVSVDIVVRSSELTFEEVLKLKSDIES